MPKLWEALLTLAILIAALAVGIIIFGVDPRNGCRNHGTASRLQVG